MLARVIGPLRKRHLQGEIMPVSSLKRLRCQLAFTLSLILAFTNLLTISTAAAQQRRRAANAPPNAAKPVRLVVGIVIDQFRYDYLTRFQDQFGEGGFKRLLNGGAGFSNANYIHAPTVTACGHATVISGSVPALARIIRHEEVCHASRKRPTTTCC